MVSEAQKRSSEKYLTKMDRVVVRIRKDGSDGITKEDVELAAKSQGMSVNQWVIDLIRDAIR